MTKVKFLSADEAAAMVKDGDTIGLAGGGGGLVEASALHAAVERSFLETGHPRNLTCIHALGIGDRQERGMNRFAHVGMTSRVIGGIGYGHHGCSRWRGITILRLMCCLVG